jgi:hypothetical protein
VRDLSACRAAWFRGVTGERDIARAARSFVKERDAHAAEHFSGLGLKPMTCYRRAAIG